MATATAQLVNHAFLKAYRAAQDYEAHARLLWEKADKLKLRSVKLAKMGRKIRAIVPISETRGVLITNRFREEPFKLFAPAFAKKFDFKEVPLAE